MYAPACDCALLKRPRPSHTSQVRRLAIGLALLCLLTFVLARSAFGGAPGAYETVTVQPGDTVWSIAAEHYPQSDTRVKVDEIERDNSLFGPELHPGQRLKLPTS